ncbi:MAG: hypothetical protein JXX28_07705 [Deltaproteobacteria bacterium]|nr:hypothetical protein [Deltaproteobacteria bacterium]
MLPLYLKFPVSLDMARIRIEPYQEHHFSALCAFAARTWPTRCRSPEFLRWRYQDPRSLIGATVAMRGEEVVASLSWARRRWWLRGEPVEAQETFDWFTLPELRGGGLGIRIIRAVMTQGPVAAVGGTADTLALLPRLGFTRVGEVAQLALPLTSRGLPARVGRLGLAADGALAAWRRGAALGAGGGLLRPLTALPLQDAPSPGLELVQIPEASVLDWLSEGPGAGLYASFAGEGGSASWSQVRVFDRGYVRTAAITEWLPSTSSPTGLRRHLSAMVRYSRGLGADRVLLSTSNRDIVRAARWSGWRLVRQIPFHTHQLGGDVGPWHVGGTTGDSAWLPNPDRATSHPNLETL